MMAEKAQVGGLIFMALVFVSPVLGEEDELHDRLRDLSASLEKRRVESHVPGLALTIVMGDRVIFSRGFGVETVEGKRAVTPETRFGLGSCTKPLTAMLLAALVDEGKIKWDDRVRDHLPHFRLSDSRALDLVTVRDILAHRSGLGEMGRLYMGGLVSREEVLQQVGNAELVGVFREKFHYSNINYLVAGMVAEAAGKAPWESLLKNRIFIPLDMTSSSALLGPSNANDRIAQGYSWDQDEQKWSPVSRGSFAACAPAGAAVSSVSDMSRFLKFLLNRGNDGGKFQINPERFEEMWTPQILISSEISTGMGWFISKWQGRKMVYHSGNVHGFSCIVSLLPEERMGFALLANIDEFPAIEESQALIWSKILGLQGLQAGNRVEDRPKPPSLDLESFVGSYESVRRGLIYTVLARDGSLALDVPGQTTYELSPPDKLDRWFFEATDDIFIQFRRDQRGGVASLVFCQKIQLPAKKLAVSQDAEVEKAGPPTGVQEIPFPWSEIFQYIGKYRIEAADVDLEVKWDNGRVLLLIPESKPSPLLWPTPEGRWVLEEDPNVEIEFIRSESQEVSGLTFSRLISVDMTRLTQKPPKSISIEGILDLRRKAEGDLFSPDNSIRVEGTVQYVSEGLSGRFTSLQSGMTRSLWFEDLGRFGCSRRCVDGERAWSESSTFGERLRELKGTELKDALIEREGEMAFLGIHDWRRAFRSLEVLTEEDWETEKAAIVHGVLHNGQASRRWIGLTTGMILKEEKEGLRTLFQDFRSVENGTIPFRIVHEILGEKPGRVVMQIEKVERDISTPSGAFCSLASEQR